MPVYGGISMVIFFAALGLPGLCGFIGEVLRGSVRLEFQYAVLTVVAASVVILTAGYILWTIQRVYLGPEYKGPHGDALVPMTRREIGIAAPLVVMAVLLGVYPRALLDYTTPTIGRMVDNLAQWSDTTRSQTPPRAPATPRKPGTPSPLQPASTPEKTPVKTQQP